MRIDKLSSYIQKKTNFKLERNKNTNIIMMMIRNIHEKNQLKILVFQ